MRKDDIKIGEAYQTRGVGRMGKAVVTGPPERKQNYSWSKAYFVFPVEYPDSLDEHDEPETGYVASKDFNRAWTDEDDAHHQKQIEQRIYLDGIRARLQNAGFQPDYVRMIGDDLWLDFRGKPAEQVVEALTNG